MKISNGIQKLPSPEHRLFWLIVLLAVKFLFLYFLISENRPTLLPSTIAVCSGDCDSYLEPIDNLIEKGAYEPDFRMPGLGFPYFLFRVITNKDVAVDLLILVQTALDALATLLLALSMYLITRKKFSFYLTLFLYGIGVTVSCYNNWIMTESLTCSVLVFAFYFLVKFSLEKKLYFASLSGLFFTWSYFLRPVNAAIFVFGAMALFLFLAKEKKIKVLLFYLLPALLINGAWTIRNYLIKEKLFMLTENVYVLSWYGEHGFAGIEFCKTFSDYKITWNYFNPEGLTYFGQAVQRFTIDDIKIPEKIFTPDFSEDSLLRLRKLYIERASPGVSQERVKEIENELTLKFKKYTNSVKKYHPFIYYVKTPLLLTKSFMLQSGVHNLFFMPFSQQPLYRKLIKLLFVVIYFAVFGIFIAGLLFYKKSFENKLILLSYVTAFYIIFIHSIFLRSIEPRYIIPAYPFFVIGAVFTIFAAGNFIQKKLND